MYFAFYTRFKYHFWYNNTWRKASYKYLRKLFITTVFCISDSYFACFFFPTKPVCLNMGAVLILRSLTVIFFPHRFCYNANSLSMHLKCRAVCLASINSYSRSSKPGIEFGSRVRHCNLHILYPFFHSYIFHLIRGLTSRFGRHSEVSSKNKELVSSDSSQVTWPLHHFGTMRPIFHPPVMFKCVF